MADSDAPAIRKCEDLYHEFVGLPATFAWRLCPLMAADYSDEIVQAMNINTRLVLFE